MVNAICVKGRGVRRNLRGTRRFNISRHLATAMYYYYCYRLRHARRGTRGREKTQRKLRCNEKDARLRVSLPLFILWGTFAPLEMRLFRALHDSRSRTAGFDVDQRCVSASLIAGAKCNASESFPSCQQLLQLSRLRGTQDFVLSSQITGDGIVRTLPRVICWSAQAAFHGRVSRRCTPLPIGSTLSRSDISYF